MKKMEFEMLKKKIVLGIILVLMLLVGNLNSQSKIGVGIVLGSVNGFSGKIWLNNRTAIDGAVSWHLWEHNVFYIHSDFLWHDSQLIKFRKGKMPFYYGIGGRLVLFENRHLSHDWRGEHYEESAILGLRLPLGIEYLSKNRRWEIFIELALLMDLAPGIDTGLDAGIGGRYYFGR